MNTRWTSTFLCAALLAISGTVTAANHGGGKAKPHEASPPAATSNRQSLDDANRALDRAGERQSDSAAAHSKAPGKKDTYSPNHGMEHRNPEHSLDSHGKGWKNTDQ